MKGPSTILRNVAAAVVFAGAALLASAQPASGIRECDGNEWAIAQCGFAYDCYYELYDPGPPEVCGVGAADECWVEGSTIFYEGWCFPTEDCSPPFPC